MMRSLIIGSTAMRHWFPNFPREPKDVDRWTIEPRMDRTTDFYWDERLDEWLKIRAARGYLGQYAHPDETLTMKVTHSSWDISNGSWPKHMGDLLWMYKNTTAKFIPEMADILYPIWTDLHGKPRVNLNQESGAFFTDAVVRIYDHDSIHDTVAHYDRPLWMEVLKDGQSVAMDMKKVWALPHGKQIELFREEVYATALERWLIPAWERGEQFSPTQAYYWSLRKTITSLTKGKSSRFMILNFDLFSHLPRLRGGTPWYVATHFLNRDKLVRL